MSAIFLLPVCLTYWPRKYTTRVDPHVDNIPTKVEVDMTIYCRVIAFFPADTSRDLVTMTFDLLTLNSWRTWRVTWPTQPPRLKSVRLFVHELWFITLPNSHWLPLKMRTRPLRMRRITWPASRGSKRITCLESPTPLCLLPIQLLLGSDDD